MWDLLLSVLPQVAAAFSPVLVAGSKKVARKVDKEIPTRAKAPLAVLIGAVLSGLLGGDPSQGALVASSAVVGRNVIRGR